MAAFRLDTAAAIRKLEGAGVDGRQAAAIVELHASADAELATKTDLQLTENVLKADIRALSQRIDADWHPISPQIETSFANFGTTIANFGTTIANLGTAIAKFESEQRRRDNAVLGSIVAMGAVILAGMAIF